jgi:hypothetical protein
MEEEESWDKIKERIKVNIELLRLIVAGLLTIGNGIVSFIDEGIFNGRKIFFITWGMLLSLALLILFVKIMKTIKHLLR